MQYLLTEKEYREFIGKAKDVELYHRNTLQELCTLAAIRVPVAKPWHHEKSQKMSPWGCILDQETDPGYCDDCPVQKHCPYTHKRWSK